MKNNHFLSNVLLSLGTILLALTLVLILVGADSEPALLLLPKEGNACAEQMMQALCAGDYAAVSQQLYGTPELGVVPESADPISERILECYLESLSYEWLGDCYALDDGLALDIRISGMDVTGTLEKAGDRAQNLLNDRIASSKDSASLYDDSNNYRQDLIDEILMTAVEQSLNQDRKFWQRELTLHLKPENGAWSVVPDAELLDIFAGAVSGG